MFDLLKISSRFMKGTVERVVSAKIEKQYGIRIDLVLDDFEVKHCRDNCQVVFKIAAQGSISEKDFRNVVEKALN